MLRFKGEPKTPFYSTTPLKHPIWMRGRGFLRNLGAGRPQKDRKPPPAARSAADCRLADRPAPGMTGAAAGRGVTQRSEPPPARGK